MKNPQIILLIAVIALFNTTCSHKKSCSGFLDYDLIYFPYQEKDTLIYKDNLGDSNIFIVSLIDKSIAYDYKCSDLYKICPCENTAKILANDKNGNPFITCELVQTDINSNKIYRYKVSDYDFQFNFNDDYDHIDFLANFTKVADIQIGNKIFTKVIKSTNLEKPESNIKEVYFNQLNGIIKYVFKNSSEVWTIKI